MRKFFLFLLGILMAFSGALAQDCKVIISSITPSGPGNPPPAVHILVSGSVSGDTCTRVSIELCCLSPTGARTGCRTQSVGVDANGNWSTLFKDFLCNCEGNSFTVIATARCLTNNCLPGELKQTIPCTPPGNTCPTVNNVTFTVGDCIDDGSGCKGRQVVFHPSISGTTDGWSFNFGDNTMPLNMPGMVPASLPPHSYFLFPPTDPVLTIFKLNCPPVSFPVTNLNFQLCDECPPTNAVTINVSSNKCVASGTITANICEANYLDFIIDFGDGSETHDISLLNGFSFTHTYAGDGTKTITITLIRPNNSNCTYTKTVSITNCCADCGGNDDDGSSCGWKFWECFSLCWFLAILAGLYVAVRLILVAWGWSINLPIGSYTWAEILDALGLGLLLLLMAFCPCEAAYMIIAGATVAIAVIIAAIIAGSVPPKWLLAILLAVILIASMIILIKEKGC